jgi:hypothetical protein
VAAPTPADPHVWLSGRALHRGRRRSLLIKPPRWSRVSPGTLRVGQVELKAFRESHAYQEFTTQDEATAANLPASPRPATPRLTRAYQSDRASPDDTLAGNPRDKKPEAPPGINPSAAPHPAALTTAPTYQLISSEMNVAITTVLRIQAITLWKVTMRRMDPEVTAVSVVPNVTEHPAAR